MTRLRRNRIGPALRLVRRCPGLSEPAHGAECQVQQMTALLEGQVFIEPGWRITMTAPPATVQSADALVIHGKPQVFVALPECGACPQQSQ